MPALFKSIAKKTAYLAAALILITAFVVCLARLAAPVLDHHKKDFEQLASQFLQTPAAIKNVRVSWFQYQPVINLHGVTILAKDRPLLKIKNVSILFSLSQSIWQRKIIPSGVLLSGANVNIEEPAVGEYSVQELSSLPIAQSAAGSATFSDMMTWISKGPRIILRDINLHYTGFTGKKRFLTLININVENNGDRHQFAGKAILHQELPTEVMVAARWEGKRFDPAQINARLYLYVSGLSLKQWAKDYFWHDWQARQGIVSAKIWADWAKGSFKNIQSIFQAYGITLYSKAVQSTFKINRLSGNVGWKQEGNQFVIAGDEILIDLPGHLWPSANFNISLEKKADGIFIPKTANVGYVNLVDIQPFIKASPSLFPETLQKTWLDLKPAGVLQNTAIVFAEPWDDWKHASFNTHFSISFAPWKNYPGVKNMSGMLNWNNGQGELSLNSNKTIVELPSLFANEIQLEQLSGKLLLLVDDKKNWNVQIPYLNLLNPDIAANVSGKMVLLPDDQIITDLNMNMSLQKAENAALYFPSKIFKKDLADWLNQAFLSGSFESSHAVLRGPLKDFPFDKRNGEFTISANIKNVDLKFAPDWPAMQHMNGNIAFTGRKININIDSAEMMGIPVSHVSGIIPYVGEAQPQILNVQANDIQTDFSQALKYIHASPLEKTLGKMFADADMQGTVTLDLALSVPLSDTDKTKVNGSLDFSDALMTMPLWDLTLKHLNGKIHFTENKTEAKNIRAELFDKPLQFDLTTLQKTKTLSVVQAKFSQHLYLSDLKKWLKLPPADFIKGDTNVTGSVDFSLTNPFQVHLKSDLTGIAIEADAPYGKKAQEKANFSTDIILQEKQPVKIKFNYSDVNAAIVLDRKQNEYQLIAAALGFGGSKAEWPDSPGIYIRGRFDVLDWEKISKYISGTKTPSSLSAAKLQEIDIQANKINAASQSFTQVHVQAIPDQHNWSVKINSNEITGQLSIPIPFDRKAFITAQIQNINIHTMPDTQKNNLVDVNKLPGIYLIANNVRYNDMALGRILFKAVPAEEGLIIQTLRVNSPYIDLTARGNWKQEDNHDVTHLSGKAVSPHVSRLLTSLNIGVSNAVLERGDLVFNLVWNNAPYAPDLGSMNGQGSLSLGAGRIVDIGDEAGAKMSIGRMLSIFSLQTIPRRLALDFSDLFQKGYSFDSIRGDFTIKNGDIFTKNLHFEGPVAKIDINGRIGLEKKDYNFILSVFANVTSSIPLAATLLTGNPLIGLGALAVNTVIGSQVSKVTSNYYHVTGSWSNPVWTPVSRP